MRTIDINLIEKDVNPSPKSKPIIEDIDDRTKKISVVAVAGAFAVFVLSTGIWLGVSYSTKNTDSELTILKTDHEKLQQELQTSTLVFKDLQQEKKILELKLLVQNQIDSSLMPWHKILVDIANTVPKDVRITKITKSSRSSQIADKLFIEGQISAKKDMKLKPLEIISYFVLNINENHSLNSYLKDAVIKSAEFDEKSEIYDFAIETAINLPKKEVPKKESRKTT